MVEIECPHCESEVELEDGVYGLFTCPHCQKDFDWSVQTKWTIEYFSRLTMRIGLGLLAIGFLSTVLLWLTEGPRNCENRLRFLDFSPWAFGNSIIAFILFAALALCVLEELISAFASLSGKIRKRLGYDF